ncbi:RagB/SusD family nutrient uptake outer membrane protein [Chitinophaga sancti]|uniref:RagB/SusD family nutrient uptake outer membrane protein n=1 Tax=Chitinophaga sancti TaxID=1004 RepID=UPI003F78BFDD
MKKLSILIMLGGIAFAGCNKQLDDQPQSSTSQATYWASATDATNAVNSCYTRLGDVDNRIFISCATDDSYSWSDWPSDVRQVGNGSGTVSTGTYNNFWSNLYRMIATCNDVTDNIDRVKMDDDLKARLKGEARFLRAFAYQQLIGLYGDVVFRDHTPAVAEFAIPRTPRATVAKWIVDELDAIAPALPISYGSSDRGRITRGAALALKARTLLYEGNYADAATAAKAVMDLGYYKIDGNYVSLFNGNNKESLELILTAGYVKTTKPNSLATWVGGPSMGGWSQVVPLQSLVDAYECTDGKTIDQSTVYDAAHPFNNRDPRLKMVVITPGDVLNGVTIDVTNKSGLDALSKNNASFTGYYYRKYLPTDIDGNWDSNSYNDMVLMRYPEVLLIYAEAKIELNQIDQSVYDAINQVRQRPGVGMPAVTAATAATQDAMREVVRRERHVEFPMEDIRLFDIRRWKIADKVMNGVAYGILNNYDASRADYGKHVVIETRSFATRDYLWPVPQSEISANSAVLPNNTGW